MSSYQSGGSTLSHFRERLIALALAGLVPVIISFLIYVIGTATGATSAPVVGYGIAACAAAPCVANGVSSLWLPAGPSEPTIIMTALNGFLLFVVLIVIAYEAFRLVTTFLSSRDN